MFLGIGAASFLVIPRHGHADTAPAVKPPVGAAVKSLFSFTGTPSWWQGATSKTDIALFHTADDGCFVSVQYKTDTIAANEAKLQKSQAQLTSNGYTTTPGATLTLTMQTNTGPQSYKLLQSAVATPSGANTVLGGQEFGYLQLAKGYVYIEGHCNTSAELPSTIPALQAVQFNVTKWSLVVSHINS